MSVTGLTPGTVYYVAVYAYSGSGATSSYNVVGASSVSAPPPTITGITALLSGGIPLGAGLPTVTTMIRRGSGYDVSQFVQVTLG